jgi:hypothetical protein
MMILAFLFGAAVMAAPNSASADNADADQQPSSPTCGSDGFDVASLPRRSAPFEASPSGFFVGELPPAAIEVLPDVQNAITSCFLNRAKCAPEQGMAQMRQPHRLRTALYGIVNYMLLRCFIDNDACREYAREPAIIDAVQRALRSDDVVLLSVEPVLLVAGNARPWHNDVEAYDQCVGKCVQVWLPTGGVNGSATLAVMTHSHTLPPFSSVFSDAMDSDSDVHRCATSFEARAHIETPITRLGQFLVSSPQLWRKFTDKYAPIKSLRLTFATPDCDAVAATNREPSQVPLPVRPPVLLLTDNVRRDTRRVVNNLLLVDRQDTFFDWQRDDSLIIWSNEVWNNVTVETVHLADAFTVSRRFEATETATLTVLAVTHGVGRLFHRHSEDLSGELMELPVGGMFAIWGGSFMLSSGANDTTFIRLTAPFASPRMPSTIGGSQYFVWPANATVMWKSTEWMLVSEPCSMASSSAAVVLSRVPPLRAMRLEPGPSDGQCVVLMPTPPAALNTAMRVWKPRTSRIFTVPLPPIPAQTFPSTLLRNASLAMRASVRGPRLTLADGTTVTHSAGFSVTIGGLVPQFSPFALRTHPHDELRVLLRGRLQTTYAGRSDLSVSVGNDSLVSLAFFAAGSRYTIQSLDEPVKFILYKWRARTNARPDCADKLRSIDFALNDRRSTPFTFCSRSVSGGLRVQYATLEAGSSSGVAPYNLTHELSVLLLDGRLNVGANSEIEATLGASVGVVHRQAGQMHSLINVGSAVARFLVLN